MIEPRAVTETNVIPQDNYFCDLSGNSDILCASILFICVYI